MIQKIIYVTKAEKSIIDQFIKRLQAVGIETRALNTSKKGLYLESSWDDAVFPQKPTLRKKGENVGCPPKEITYNGNPITCSSVYELREKGISDARIAELLDVSESTVTRRRKRHMKEGNFYASSKTRF